MYDWHLGPDEIPSPQLLTAWLILGTLATERVPNWAAYWIADGRDGQALAELAGLRGDDQREVRDLLGPALAECGFSAPGHQVATAERERAAAMIAFTAIARLQAIGRASERWVVQKVVQVAEPDFDDAVISLPLGQLYALDDEWGAGWGRADEQLCAVVRQSCAAQLEAAPSGKQRAVLAALLLSAGGVVSVDDLAEPSGGRICRRRRGWACRTTS